MLYSKKTEYLMESIRSGRTMARSEKLNLIVGLSIPSMLAQISTVLMFLLMPLWLVIWVLRLQPVSV